MVLDGEAIVIRIGLVKKAQESNSRQYQDMIAELEKIIAMSPSVSEKGQAENLKTQLENAKSSYEQGVATTKVVLETQTANLSREKVFSDKNVSWTGLLSMIKKEQGANKTPKDALDNLMKKFDQKGWDASREEEKDATLLSDLEKAGYLRFSGSAGSLEYGHKVVTALREIQKDWSKYEKVINGTEALDAGKFIVPKADDFSNWKNDSQKIANFLADVSGDGILSQTNQVTRMGFLGLFGREDMNKKQLSELGTAKLLQDVIPKDPTDFWNKLGVIAPTTPTQIE